MKRRQMRLWLSGLVVCAAVAALGPAGVASADPVNNPEACNSDGRLFCLTVSTFENITASDPNLSSGKRYTWVEWTMHNKSGTTLTHPTVTVTLADYCNAATAPEALCAGTNPTSAFVLPDSSNACTLKAGALTCKYPNLPADGSTGGGATGTPTRIYFETADAPATFTRITVRGTVKERANDANTCASGDPNCDTFTTSIDNSYEPLESAAYTFALNGKPFHLATNDELSSFDFTSLSPSIFRADFTTSTSGCEVPTPTCFQRVLDVSTVGAPEAGYNDGPVVFYARLTNLPSGVNANNVIATHTYDDATTIPTTIIIGDQSSERSNNGCTTTYSLQIPVPSICAKKVQGVPQALDVWVWDSKNGQIKFG